MREEEENLLLSPLFSAGGSSISGTLFLFSHMGFACLARYLMTVGPISCYSMRSCIKYLIRHWSKKPNIWLDHEFGGKLWYFLCQYTEKFNYDRANLILVAAQWNLDSIGYRQFFFFFDC